MSTTLLQAIRAVDTLITPPGVPAVELALAKAHLRVTSAREDQLIAAYIDAATNYVEEQTNRQLITATWQTAFDGPPDTGRIELGHAPLQAVVSVLYTDGDGAEQSFSSGGSPDTPLYTVDAPSGPFARLGSVEPNDGESWPTVADLSGAFRVQYRAGYGDAPEDIPGLLQAALLWLVGHFYQHRAPVHEGRLSLTEVPQGLKTMIDPFKYSAYPTLVARRTVTVTETLT